MYAPRIQSTCIRRETERKNNMDQIDWKKKWDEYGFGAAWFPFRAHKSSLHDLFLCCGVQWAYIDAHDRRWASRKKHIKWIVCCLFAYTRFPRMLCFSNDSGTCCWHVITHIVLAFVMDHVQSQQENCPTNIPSTRVDGQQQWMQGNAVNTHWCISWYYFHAAHSLH